MNPLPLLVVTVLGAGGPPSLAREHLPIPLSNSTITVSRDVAARARPIASSAGGRISLRLPPGLYTVSALLHDEPGMPQRRNCEAKTVRLRRAGRPLLIELHCSIS
jgi:hypothetical protein